MHQEMDGINARFRTPAFFKKEKEQLVVYSESNIFLKVNTRVSHQVNVFREFKHVLLPFKGKEDASLFPVLNFFTSLLRAFSEAAVPAFLPTDTKHRQPSLAPGTLHSQCVLITHLKGCLVPVSCPQWDANKISANQLFPLMGWISSPHNVCGRSTPLCLRMWLF